MFFIGEKIARVGVNIEGRTWEEINSLMWMYIFRSIDVHMLGGIHRACHIGITS